MENSDVKLSTENLCIQFGSKVTIKNINIHFPEKNITALIGPSGCGKTTLLRSFNRMHDLVPEAKVSGRVLMDGINLYDSSLPVTSVRRRIGMVFQKPNPFPASIYDNVAYGLKINGVHKTEIASLVEQSLKESFLCLEDSNKDYALQEPLLLSRKSSLWTNPVPHWTRSVQQKWKNLCWN